MGGAVITTTGGPGPIGFKASFDENSPVDRTARFTLEQWDPSYVSYPFVPDGSDERQYSSPGVRIPTITISKDKYYEYDEYHTSKDNLDFVKAEYLAKTLAIYKDWIDVLEMNRTYKRVSPYCEYQLGKRGLYPHVGGRISQNASLEDGECHESRVHLTGSEITGADIDCMNWLMFGLDGETDLLSLSKRSGLPLALFDRNVKLFLKENLVKVVK